MKCKSALNHEQLTCFILLTFFTTNRHSLYFSKTTYYSLTTHIFFCILLYYYLTHLAYSTDICKNTCKPITYITNNTLVLTIISLYEYE